MKRIRRLISNYLVVIIIFAGGIFLIVAFVPNYTTLQRLQRQRLLIKQKLILAEKKNQSLQAEIAGLENDPEGIERIAREKLGWVGPEETVYRFRSPEEKSD